MNYIGPLPKPATSPALLLEMLQKAIGLFQAGQLSEAETLCRQILVTDPDSPDAQHLLGQVCARQGDLALNAGDSAGAEAAYAEAARLRPGWFQVLANRGIALARLQRHLEAEAALREALQIRPDSEPVLTTLAGILSALGRHAEAADVGRRAVAAGPGQPEAWNNLGQAVHAEGRLADAADAYEHALAIAPDFAMSVYNLSQVRSDQWRAAEAWSGFLRAVELDPGYAPAWHALLFNSLYDPEQTEESIFEIHRRWGQQVGVDPPVAAPARLHSDWPSRRLRVGYVSPDFHTHSCAYFLQPLFAEHDRSVVEIFAYSAVERPDLLTDWFRSHSDHWRNLRGLGDRDAAGLIRADGIDILVDLAGHTLNHPIEIFALQAAPVQVAWLGYPATSGLAQIGYRLTDSQADPPGDADRFHTERLVRLPGGFHCYRAPVEAPEVSPLPAARNGFVTFGSFNNLAKVTPEVIATWARILDAVPRSRLLLKGRLLRYDDARARITAEFAQAGVDPARVDLQGWIPPGHGPLAVYANVDIALDTFPYNGTTTTFEALWMGVPVITLRGKRHAGRVGASVLTHLGRPEWIADDVPAYVGTARRLASDLPALADIRGTLRSALARSSLADAPGFARKIETAWREMLQRTTMA